MKKMEAHSRRRRTFPFLSSSASAGGLVLLALVAACGSGAATDLQPGGGSGGSAAGGAPVASGGSLASGGSGGGSSAGGAASGGTSSGGTNSGGAPPASGGAPTGPPVARHGALSVVGPQLVDAAQSPVQLKGPSSMWLNWEEDGYAENLDGLRFMRDDWNASVVRAAMGVTTTDPFDADYLDQPEEALARVRAIVDHAIELDLYVIIDWHDHEAHTRQSEAIAFFTQMATEYGHLPNVLYEVFNEPLSPDGDGHTWDGVLKPYHEAVVTAIRAVDPDNVIILGTPNWSQHVDTAAMNPLDATNPIYKNLMYTLHFYACSHQAELRERGDAALALGLPLFVTEWGATHADGGTADNPGVCVEEAQAWHDWMGDNGISWAAWKWDNCPDESCFFVEEGADVAGNWTDDVLHGHGSFVRDRMRE